MMLNPANEYNERDNLFLLGQIGAGPQNMLHLVKLTIVESLILIAPDGEINGKGVTFEKEGDMNHIKSSV